MCEPALPQVLYTDGPPIFAILITQVDSEGSEERKTWFIQPSLPIFSDSEGMDMSETCIRT